MSDPDLRVEYWGGGFGWVVTEPREGDHWGNIYCFETEQQARDWIVEVSMCERASPGFGDEDAFSTKQ